MKDNLHSTKLWIHEKLTRLSQWKKERSWRWRRRFRFVYSTHASCTHCYVHYVTHNVILVVLKVLNDTYIYLENLLVDASWWIGGGGGGGGSRGGDWGVISSCTIPYHIMPYHPQTILYHIIVCHTMPSIPWNTISIPYYITSYHTILYHTIHPRPFLGGGFPSFI